MNEIIGSFMSLLIFSPLIILFFVLPAWWLYRDAENRGKSGFLAILLVLFLSWPGLIIWLLFRPDEVVD